MENDESNRHKEDIYNRDFNEAVAEDKAVSKLAQVCLYDAYRYTFASMYIHLCWYGFEARD